MGISEKVMEALRAGILLNVREVVLLEKVDRMDQDLRKINDRVVRLETIAELSPQKLLK